MPQLWTDDVFALSHEGETDLQNIENNFQALRTLFSGASFTINTDPGHPWYDTSTPIGGEGLLKIRKQGDDGWLGVLALGQESNNGLVWFHGDNLSNQEGWVIDTQITEDRVMALKNHGSGTYTTGRAVAGSWVITGISVNNMALSIAQMPPHTHDQAATDPGGAQANKIHVYKSTGRNYTFWTTFGRDDGLSRFEPSPQYLDTYSTGGGAVHGHTVTHAEGWKIKGQVGIVIYPDI